METSQSAKHQFPRGYTYHLSYNIPLLHFKGMSQLMMPYPNKLKLPNLINLVLHQNSRATKVRLQFVLNSFD